MQKKRTRNRLDLLNEIKPQLPYGYSVPIIEALRKKGTTVNRKDVQNVAAGNTLWTVNATLILREMIKLAKQTQL